MNGTKRFEYRKRIFKKDVDSVVIYSTMPVGKIVGEFTIDEIINDSPKVIWDKTCSLSGITEDYFFDYFSGRDDGFAIKIKKLIRYDEPINPKDLDSKFIAPQSYKYLYDETELSNNLLLV